MRKILAAVAAGLLLSTAGMAAQEALGTAMTLRGEIVEVSCFSKGVAQSTGASHVACAKECAQKGQPLAILTEEDGLIKITGDYAANKYAKLMDFIGKQVEVRGTSDRYLDYSRAIKVTTITAAAARQKQ
jgi:hypothetical protein